MKDRTELVILLDRSGSMQGLKNDHEGGLRSFVRDQKMLEGDVRLTFVRFDTANPFEIVLDGEPITHIDESVLTLVPRGGTPLLDAVGRTIVHMTSRVKALSPSPQQVVFLIITDGEENSSREYSKEQISRLITEHEQGNWKFLYLGANVDAFHEAGSMGIAPALALNYAPTSEGTAAAYFAATANICAARSALARGETWGQVSSSYTWTDEQRASTSGDASNPQTRTAHTTNPPQQ